MKTRSSVEIRQLFLEFFESKNHAIEPGVSLIPHDDTTLLWINSGVAALKKYFDGRMKPKNPRIVNIQKSLRTNDIENVGKTARHHTFFEMMGNFSIGDYFKEEAIAYAYEFLFSEAWMGLDVNRAYISVHTADDDAFKYWTENQKIPAERILRTDANFWQIGNGPCGPNSEIFYDRGAAYDPEGIGERLFFEDLENDRYVEVWNIVFSQYDGVEGGDPATFKELPQKNIDTGMGFERLVSIVQDGKTNFDTDLFLPLIDEIETLTTQTYVDNNGAYRVISDHIRALVFALGDGAMFSNEGRGYVLRRILRRAVRFGRVLNIQKPFLYRLVDSVIEIMSDFYPNLVDRRDIIQTLIMNEEQRFSKTLNEGESLLLAEIKASSNAVLPGAIAFKLYDTYGFPIELTQEIAQEQGVDVDLDGFEMSLQAQRERARTHRQKTESMTSQQGDLMNFSEPSVFRYDVLETSSKVIGLFKEGQAVESLEGKGMVIFDTTPFYAESGGQVGDTGIVYNDHLQGIVMDTTKANQGQHLHHVEVEDLIHLGDRFTLAVNEKRRIAIRKNHSAVHLLQSALRKHLGTHVTQAGSYVDDEYLRFDFNHFERVKPETLKAIELLINEWISYSYPIVTEEMALETAQTTGAMALFSENYGDIVRVVSMGDVSKELCGGTHALNTGEIGSFIIESEESVGSGVRRIVARTAFNAYKKMQETQAVLTASREFLKLTPQTSLLAKLEAMQEAYEALNKKHQELQKHELDHKVLQYGTQVQTNAAGLSFIWVEEHKLERDVLKQLVDRLRDTTDIVIGVNQDGETLQFMVGCSEKAISSGFKAGDLAKEVAVLTDGNGGGKPQFAQSGGKNSQKLVLAKEDIFTKVGIELLK